MIHRPTRLALLSLLVAMVTAGALAAPSALATQAAEEPLGKLAFVGNPIQTPSDIYVANAVGSGKVNLTAGFGLDSADAPAWSPDGTKIAFRGYGPPEAPCCDAYVMDAGGTNLVRLSNTGTLIACTPCGAPLAWSPDGTKVAYIQGNGPEGAGYDIYESTADGSVTNRLTNLETSLYSLTWGPTGSIAFEATRSDPWLGWSGIFVLNPATGVITQLTPVDLDGGDYQAAWSPDGATIAFIRDPAFSPGPDLHTMDYDGANQVNVSQNESAFISDPVSWAPDESQIAYTFDPSPTQTGDTEIYVANVDGSGQLPVTNDGGNRHAAWSPDGTWIAFDDTNNVWLVTPDGSQISPVTGGGDRSYSSAAWAPPPSGVEYVGLGDSFSSGEGIPPFDGGTDIEDVNECHRSAQAYARQFEASHPEYALIHRSCSGAIVGDFYSSKWLAEPAQLDWLGSSTQLVTLTIGGNDVGFAPLMTRCARWRRCQSSQQAAKTRQAIATWLPGRLEALYGNIRRRTSTATIVVMGYPNIIPDPVSITEGCSGLNKHDEMPWLRETAGLLNEAIRTAVHERQAAGDANIQFLDVLTAFSGHEVCTFDPWVNPIVFFPNLEYSFHPNEIGQTELASRLEDCVLSLLCELESIGPDSTPSA